MATIRRCPSCGEDEHLHGRSSGDDIEVTCESCGTRWQRGAARCNSCGREDVVVRPQVMTRHPRGNQLAIVGRRELPLCPDCDAAAIAESLTGNRPVPETYVSVFLFGRDMPRDVSTAPAVAAGDSSTGDAAQTEPAAQAPKVAPPPARQRPGTRAGSARPTPARTAPQEVARPTVRQAIEAYLRAHPDADSLAMLFLGQHLGPASRLEVLDRPGAAESVTRWFDTTWTDRQPDRRRAAAAAITGAVDHWRTEGWLTEDPAAALRQTAADPVVTDDPEGT